MRPWHDRPGALERFISDLVADELARLRPGAPLALPPRPWPAAVRLDEDGIGLDSLDRMAAAAALTEALHLHESGIEDLLLAQRGFGEWVETAAESLRRFDAALTFRTSGSTGTPKPCRHVLAALQHEVEALAGLSPLRGAVGRVLAAVPSHHICGFLFTHLLPARLGAVETVDVRGLTAPALRHQLRAGDLVIGHPAFWRLFAQHGLGTPLPHGVRGVSSTAPCPDALGQGLVDQGLESLLQVYGSSETAGIGWRDCADAWVRTRLPAPARPRAIEFGAALPVDRRGKACDWSITASVGAGSS